MKKLSYIIILVIILADVSVVFDSCLKECVSDCHHPYFTPTESVCEINGIERKFNYCYNFRGDPNEQTAFYNLENVENGLDFENKNFAMIFSKRINHVLALSPPIENKTYTLEDMSVHLYYPFPNVHYKASLQTEGSSLIFKVTSVYHYCEGCTDFLVYAIHGTYSLVVIEETSMNPDTLKVTNGIFVGLSGF